jgi:hypothetical protein
MLGSVRSTLAGIMRVSHISLIQAWSPKATQGRPLRKAFSRKAMGKRSHWVFRVLQVESAAAIL